MERTARLAGGELDAALSHALVSVQTTQLGREPAHTSAFHHGNVVVTVVYDALTKAERILAANGNHADVAETRHLLNSVVDADLRAAVEAVTGRTVTVSLSAGQVDLDVAATIFILDAPP
jgi:uncharacterized protein YbcI